MRTCYAISVDRASIGEARFIVLHNTCDWHWRAISVGTRAQAEVGATAARGFDE